MTYGIHAAYDLIGCNQFDCQSMDLIAGLLADLVKVIEMEVICPPIPVRYKNPAKPLQDGVSASILISTSHCAIHTYPFADGWVFLDIFSCKEFDLAEAKKFIVSVLQPRDVTERIIRRGEGFPMEIFE